MYEFIDVNEVSESVLPSEALMINGDYIENLIEGYRTLQVIGREALTAELHSYESGVRDGSVLQSKRYPARYITVKFQLLADSPESFRSAFNKLAGILNVEEAELIFNDEPDKFFIGTPETIEEIPGGTNSVIGSFTIFCADPFKYSVQEYEAEAEANEDVILIDYTGTYKSYPKLEAQFHEESEFSELLNQLLGLTSDGDCGYVAFFNEKEKIIQMGDPDETLDESFAKSQTLVNQKFQSETAWNNIAQTNWATNTGKISKFDIVQAGNFKMAVTSWLTTTAPSTTGTLLSVTSKAAKPNIKYTVSAQTSNRTDDTITVKVTVKTALVGSTGGTTSVSKGAKITLNKTKLYSNSTTSTASSTKTGTYYCWDSSVVNGRIRITNTSSNVGKSGQVTGWVDVDDIGVTSSGVSLGKGYGLKAGIQFNNGDWHYATLKAETASWSGNDEHTTTFSVKVRDIDPDTVEIEEIKFKVDRTDDEDSKAGILDETYCKELEISSYTSPVAETWYLTPETYGSDKGWHGPSLTRTIPADASGDTGAENFTFSYKQKMSIGNSSTATKEYGLFNALLVNNSNEIIAGVSIYKQKVGTTSTLRFWVNNKVVHTMELDLSYNNKYMGNNSPSKGITTVKTSTITKDGKKVKFNIGGIEKTFTDSEIENSKVTQIKFYIGKHGTNPELACNGLYWVKFVKNNCDTYKDVPNKFSANDVVYADCKSGEIFLNDISTPSLGALGNDWEDFYLSPGMNQIGYSYSDWVKEAPKIKIKYREVFI